jgi:hypothetical protein
MGHQARITRLVRGLTYARTTGAAQDVIRLVEEAKTVDDKRRADREPDQADTQQSMLERRNPLAARRRDWSHHSVRMMLPTIGSATLAPFEASRAGSRSGALKSACSRTIDMNEPSGE